MNTAAERLTAKAVAAVMERLFPAADPEVGPVLMQEIRAAVLPAVVTALCLPRKVDLEPSPN